MAVAYVPDAVTGNYGGQANSSSSSSSVTRYFRLLKQVDDVSGMAHELRMTVSRE